MKTKTEPVQNDRTQLATVQLSDDERKLVERINERGPARRVAQAGLIRRLMSSPLIFY